MNLRALFENPAAVIGVVRALSLVATAFGIEALTPERTDSLVVLTGAILALMSLVFTGITVAKTQPKPVPVDEAVVKPASGEGGGNIDTEGIPPVG